MRGATVEAKATEGEVGSWDPSKAIENMGSLTYWAMAVWERVRTGLRQGTEGRLLGRAIVELDG